MEYIIINNPRSGTYRLKIINWDAPSSGVPAGLTAVVIRGDPTPSMSLTTTTSLSKPSIGSLVKITAKVSNPSYIASGVYLEKTSMSSGLTFEGVSTTREDGVTMDFTDDELTLGNIVEGDSRSAVWSFSVNSAGLKTVGFRAWSENGGTETKTVIVSP